MNQYDNNVSFGFDLSTYKLEDFEQRSTFQERQQILSTNRSTVDFVFVIIKFIIFVLFRNIIL